MSPELMMAIDDGRLETVKSLITNGVEKIRLKRSTNFLHLSKNYQKIYHSYQRKV